MTRKTTFYIIIFISAVLLAIFTRFYKLGEAPAGLYLDEAAQGYNAYSILLTGKDEFGKLFPVVFRSFTDFKTPIYIYLIVPLLPLFGLTKFAVRFPSFFFSILTIPILYLLVKRITSKKYAISLSLISVLLLSISPWHILFGRTNFECNVALFLFLTGIYFFYLGLEKPKRLLLSALFFAIAIPAYHAQRVITPLIMIILFYKYKKTLLSNTHVKYLIIGLILGFIILLPTLIVVVTPGFLARASGLNIFSQQIHRSSGYIDGCRGILCPIINNPIFLSIKEFIALYVSYFSPREMFNLGDYGPRSSFPDLATFFIWQAPFYIIGLYQMLKKKGLGQIRFFTLVLLIISPIPAAVTRDPYSTIRSLQMVIPQIIIVALGIRETYIFAKQKAVMLKTPIRFFQIFILLSSIVVISYSILRLYSSVIILNEYYRPGDWNYGWEGVVDVLKQSNQSLPVIVDNARSEPYSQLLFFLKYDPTIYQKENFEVPLSEYYTNMKRNTEKKIGRIITRPINWVKDLPVDEYLVGDALAISDDQIKTHGLYLIRDIKYPNGEIAFRIVKTKP